MADGNDKTFSGVFLIKEVFNPKNIFKNLLQFGQYGQGSSREYMNYGIIQYILQVMGNEKARINESTRRCAFSKEIRFYGCPT